MADIRSNQWNTGSLENVRLLSAIFPVPSGENFAQSVDEILEILCDARVPFELVMISSRESNIDENEFLQQGRKYPQVQPILCPSMTSSKAVSMAIRRCSGDMIVILDQGSKATTQLLNLLQDMIGRSDHWSHHQRKVQAKVDQVLDEYFQEMAVREAEMAAASAIENTASPIENVVISPVTESSSWPNPGGIDQDVIQRLDRWAKAISSERDNHRVETEPTVSEIPQNRPYEKEKGSGSEEIRRIDSQPQGIQKKRLPKFITHFHEFI